MKLTNLVTDLKTSKTLYYKGIRRKSNYVWVFYNIAWIWVLKENKGIYFVHGSIPAYTLSELGEMFQFGDFSMQPVIKISNNLWTVPKNDSEKVSFINEVNARAFYLIRLLEQKKVTVDQINGVLTTSKLVPVAEMVIAKTDPDNSNQQSNPS